MRRILLQAIAGGTSFVSSCLGIFIWWQFGGSFLYATRSLLLTCLLEVLSFSVFVLYLRWHRTGVTLAWLLLSGSWFAAFLLLLGGCAGQSCTTVDTLRIAGETIRKEPFLWLQIAAAVCLTLDYSELAVLQLRSRRAASTAPGSPDQP